MKKPATGQVGGNMKLEESAGRPKHSHIYAGDILMRRDDDLVRKLMLDFEAQDDPLLFARRQLSMTPEETAKYYHLRLLADAGFLEETGRNGGVFRMTNTGHDFCAAIRDDTIWNKTKAASASVAGVSLAVMRDIGIGYLRAKLTEPGIPLG